MGVRMRVFLALLVASSASAFAKTGDNVFAHQDPGNQTLDCPMVNTRIIGAQTDIWPDVAAWQECATIRAGVPACKFWTLSSMELKRWCYLWSSMTGESQIPNNTSGERGCLGWSCLRGGLTLTIEVPQLN